MLARRSWLYYGIALVWLAVIAWLGSLSPDGTSSLAGSFLIGGWICLGLLGLAESIAFLGYLDDEYPDLAAEVHPFSLGGHWRILGLAVAPRVHDDVVYTGYARAIRASLVIPLVTIIMMVVLKLP